MELDENTAIAQASVAAEAWLELLDAGEVEASWEAASSLFRQLVALPQWRESFETLRSVVGRTVQRELGDVRYTTSIPGAPDGEYVVSEYAAGLERKEEAVEMGGGDA